MAYESWTKILPVQLSEKGWPCSPGDKKTRVNAKALRRSFGVSPGDDGVLNIKVSQNQPRPLWQCIQIHLASLKYLSYIYPTLTLVPASLAKPQTLLVHLMPHRLRPLHRHRRLVFRIIPPAIPPRPIPPRASATQQRLPGRPPRSAPPSPPTPFTYPCRRSRFFPPICKAVLLSVRLILERRGERVDGTFLEGRSPGGYAAATGATRPGTMGKVGRASG